MFSILEMLDDFKIKSSQKIQRVAVPDISFTEQEFLTYVQQQGPQWILNIKEKFMIIDELQGSSLLFNGNVNTLSEQLIKIDFPQLCKQSLDMIHCDIHDIFQEFEKTFQDLHKCMSDISKSIQTQHEFLNLVEDLNKDVISIKLIKVAT